MPSGFKGDISRIGTTVYLSRGIFGWRSETAISLRSRPWHGGSVSATNPKRNCLPPEFLQRLGFCMRQATPRPWISALACRPTRATVLDYGARWAIEPLFSDFKTRGFCLEKTHLSAPDRLSRLILLRALAMYWCVRLGRDDALNNPTPTEKKPRDKPTPLTGVSVKPIVARSLGSNEVYVSCSEALQCALPIPPFFVPIETDRW